MTNSTDGTCEIHRRLRALEELSSVIFDLRFSNLEAAQTAIPANTIEILGILTFLGHVLETAKIARIPAAR
jgi:hypothetical protein